MFRHYLLTALRNAWRHRVTTAINIFGLALGLTFFIVAWGFLTLERNGDRNLAKSDRIYFVAKMSEGINWLRSTPEPLAAYLRADFPALERVSLASDYGGTAMGDKGLLRYRLVLADPHFLRIFDLPFLHGDSRTALDKPRSVILTRGPAQRMFGSTDIVGKPVRIKGVDLTVTGVLDAIPGPTHIGPDALGANRLSFDVLASIDVAAQLNEEKPIAVEDWNSEPPRRDNRTYILFPANGGMRPETLNRAFPAFMQRHVPAKTDFAFEARPISTIRHIGDELTDTAVILTIGSFILAVGCLNYANLAGALAIGRAREIGLRKVLGAQRGQLVRQYLFESALQTALGFTTAATVLALLLPIFNRMQGYPVGIFLVQTPSFWLGLLACFCTVSVLAGAYPAFIALRATPASALRAFGNRRHSGFGPKLLVALQFALASFLLVAVINGNMHRNAISGPAPDPSADPVVAVRNLKSAGVNLDAFGAQLRHSPHIAGFSATQSPIWSMVGAGAVASRAFWRADHYDFFETMGIKLLAGRTFSRSRSDDVASFISKISDRDQLQATRPYNIVVDAAFAARMKWTPQEAVGKLIKGGASSVMLTIIGVVENNAATAGGAPIGLLPLAGGGMAGLPVVYQLDQAPEAGSFEATALIRVRKSDLPAALADIDAAWKRLAPTKPIRRQFLDEERERMHDSVRGQLLALAAFLACGFFIAISSLAGMAVHVVSRRTHEIGVRKTLGSTVAGILRLLMLSFTKPIIAGCILGWPLAYAVVVMANRFADPVAINPLPFLLSLAITVLIGAIAVAVPAWRAARVNPADVLHYE